MKTMTVEQEFIRDSFRPFVVEQSREVVERCVKVLRATAEEEGSEQSWQLAETVQEMYYERIAADLVLSEIDFQAGVYQ